MPVNDLPVPDTDHLHPSNVVRYLVDDPVVSGSDSVSILGSRHLRYAAGSRIVGQVSELPIDRGLRLPRESVNCFCADRLTSTT